MTGKENFLTPYHSGREEFYKRMERLEEVAANNPERLKALQQAETILNLWETGPAESAIGFAIISVGMEA